MNDLTLEEAIAHAEEVADYDCYNDDQRACANEHRQLAEWLKELKRIREAATDTDTISRQAALDALGEAPEVWTDSPEEFAALNQWEYDLDAIKAVPSAEPKTGRDCTDFVRWLINEVMDEENWELNAVANGEIICRKLKKLGLLDVEGGFYVETQKTGKCKTCKRSSDYRWSIGEDDTRCPIEEHYALPKDGYCHLWEKRNITDDDYPERRE